MANIRLGNTFYIDTQYSVGADELAVKNVKILQAFITATAANGRVVLSDAGLGIKVDLRNATSGTTYQLLLENTPMIFSTSIRPTTLSNAVVSLIIEEGRG